MKLLLCILVLFAAPASASPREESLTALATRIGTAAIAGDRATVMKHMITYEQATALSRRAADRGKKRFNEYVEDFFDSARHDRVHGEIVDARIIRSGTLTPAHDEVTRDLDYAFVQLTIETDCNGCSTSRARANLRVFRLLFLKTPAGWRLAFK